MTGNTLQAPTFKPYLILYLNLENVFTPFILIQLYFYPSKIDRTHPNEGWSGLYIKLCLVVCCIRPASVVCCVTHWTLSRHEVSK